MEIHTHADLFNYDKVENYVYLFLSLSYYCCIFLILVPLLETSGLQIYTIEYLCALILLTQNQVVINLIKSEILHPRTLFICHIL